MSENIKWVVVLTDKQEVVVNDKIKKGILEGSNRGARFVEFKGMVVNPAYIVKMYQLEDDFKKSPSYRDYDKIEAVSLDDWDIAK